jgi:hypothetical protein
VPEQLLRPRGASLPDGLQDLHAVTLKPCDIQAQELLAAAAIEIVV